jgi:hypothetical protein
MIHRPYFIGGLLVLASYFWNWIRGVQRTIPDELMALRRSDQLKRLKLVVQRRFHPAVSRT